MPQNCKGTKTRNTKNQKHQNQKTAAIQTGWLFYLEEKVDQRMEVLTTIREVAERLGHPPTFIELETMTPLRRRAIRKHFVVTVTRGRYASPGWEIDDNARTDPNGQAVYGMGKRRARRLKKSSVSIKEFEEASTIYGGRVTVPEEVSAIGQAVLEERWRDCRNGNMLWTMSGET